MKMMKSILITALASLGAVDSFSPSPLQVRKTGRNVISKVSASIASEDASSFTFTPPDTFGEGGISEEACTEAASRMKQINVPVPEYISPKGEVGISYIHWPAEKKKAPLPLLLIHGFDSSCLEYRRLGPKLASLGIDTYAVDLLGWGYTQLNDVSTFSAQAKVDALASFWNTISSSSSSSNQVCVAGASLGGAAAIEFAAANPEMVRGAIFIDAQGFVDGVGPMASLPKPLAKLGVKVLKSVPLRSSANQMSYSDPQTYATEDALRVGRLHCLRDGWDDALVSFMLSGGFSPSQKVETIQCPSLVLWGRDDGILEKEFAQKFIDTLPDAQLQWIEECGHVPHLEKSEDTALAINSFLRSDKFDNVPVNNNNNNNQQQQQKDGNTNLNLALGIGGLAGAAALASAAATVVAN